jgi:hypothetical protein
MKCPICNECLDIVNIKHTHYRYCLLCDKYFRVKPGMKLVEISKEDVRKGKK